MMNDRDFDKKIRNIVDSCEEPIGEDLWSGIEKGIIRSRRITIFRRAAFSVSAAACLVMGLVLINSEDNDYSIKVAEVSIKEIPTPQIATPQIVKLSKLTAYAKPAKSDLYLQPEAAIAETLPQENPAAEEEILVPETPVQETPAQEIPTQDEVEKPQYANDTEWIEEKPDGKQRRRMMLGVTANIMAANPGSHDFSIPQYAPGIGSTSNYGIVPISEPKFFFPITFGVQMQIPLSKEFSTGKGFSIGVGVNYTLLHSEYQALIDNSMQGMVDQNLHYLGVPVTLYWNILNTNKINFYVDGGGMIEKGLQSKCSIKDLNDVVSYRTEKISGVQWSANLGLGFEYRFIDFLGIYLDPSITYFFDTDQPFSVRTSQPLQFKMELGFRFHL